MKVGVLALQGSFSDHVKILKKCKVDPVEVRLPKDLDEVSGLILPGGESTTIIKLMKLYGLDKAIIDKYNKGMPIYGTCAGAILLSKNIIDSKQESLNLVDISIKRNAYGRQIDSFEAELEIENIGEFKGIFIRAPVIESTNNGVNVLATFENKAVMIEQENVLISTFHPELTDDTRVHKYFLDKIEN